MRAGLTQSSISNTSIFMRIIAIRQRAQINSRSKTTTAKQNWRKKLMKKKKTSQRMPRIVNETANIAGWSRGREWAAKIIIIFFFPSHNSLREWKIKLSSGSTECLHIIISLHFISFFACHSKLFGCSARCSPDAKCINCTLLWWCCCSCCWVDAAKRFVHNSFASLSFIFDYCFPLFFPACTFPRFGAFFFFAFSYFHFSGRCTLRQCVYKTNGLVE